MLYTDRIKNLAAVYPKLSRVWIKTDNPRMPLKSVWISETALHRALDQSHSPQCRAETAELAEDHLLCIAYRTNSGPERSSGLS